VWGGQGPYKDCRAIDDYYYYDDEKQGFSATWTVFVSLIFMKHHHSSVWVWNTCWIMQSQSRLCILVSRLICATVPPPLCLTCRFAHQYFSVWWGVRAECASSPPDITLWACCAQSRRVSLVVFRLTRAARGRTTNLPRVPVGCGRRHQLQSVGRFPSSERRHVLITLSGCWLLMFVSCSCRVPFVSRSFCLIFRHDNQMRVVMERILSKFRLAYIWLRVKVLVRSSWIVFEVIHSVRHTAVGSRRFRLAGPCGCCDELSSEILPPHHRQHSPNWTELLNLNIVIYSGLFVWVACIVKHNYVICRQVG
jgi:hypothetical protein